MPEKKNLLTVEGMTKKALLPILGLPSIKVLNRKLKPYEKLIGKKHGWYYDCKQVELIISLLGVKKVIDSDEVDSTEKQNSSVQKRIAAFEKDHK